MASYEWLEKYLVSKPGATEEYKIEWEWMRYLVAGKQFAAICTPGEEHGEHAGRRMIILKCDPLYAEELRKQHKDIVPGFYSNKQHWNSVYLDAEISDELLKELCDASYQLIVEKLPKKVQATL